MKRSLLCISSLYIALFCLGKPIEVNSQFARIGGNFFTYHKNILNWDEASDKCKGSSTGVTVAWVVARSKTGVSVLMSTNEIFVQEVKWFPMPDGLHLHKSV